MPSVELLIAFATAAAVFAYMPGPSTLYAAAQTLARGRRAGLFAALGLHIGGYVHVVAAALGLAVLFAAIPTLYLVLKLVGAGYLIWLGIRMFLISELAEPDRAETDVTTGRRTFWQSATVEILNPKTAIFYVAFLPQFTEASALLPLWAQMLILGMIVNWMFSSADLLCVFLADKITAALRRSTAANHLANRLGGTLLVGLGLHLATNR